MTLGKAQQTKPKVKDLSTVLCSTVHYVGKDEKYFEPTQQNLTPLLTVQRINCMFQAYESSNQGPLRRNALNKWEKKH